MKPLMKRVELWTADQDRFSLDDAHAAFPEHTREQVARALHNLSRLGRINCVKRIKAVTRGGAPGIYEPGPAGRENEPTRPRGTYGIPRISSVFDLGANLNPRSGGTAATT